jgi:Ca2+-binding RTX toxin-like protein/Mg-chelatase subunit ChlD
VTFVAFDGTGNSNVATATVSFNGGVDSPPMAGNDVFGTVEDQTLTVGPGGVLANDADPDLDAISAVLVSGPSFGTLASFGSDGSFTYVPAAGFNGVDTFTYHATAGGLDSGVATVQIVVSAVNDAPRGADATRTIDEDQSYVFALVDFGFADPDDTPPDGLLGVRIATLPASGTLSVGGAPVNAGDMVAVSDINAGRLIFTPAPDANGLGYAQIGFQVRDDGGTANGGVDTDPTPNTITFNVSAVNDGPVNTVPGAQSTNEDTPKPITGLSIADVDAGSGSMTVTLSVTNGTLSVSGGTAAIAGSGTSTVTLTGTLAQINATLSAVNGVTYVPSANFNGAATLTMVTNDGGNTGSGGALSDADTVAITVNPVNDAPVNTVPASIAVTEDVASPVTGISVNDVDAGSSSISVTLSVPAGTLAATSGSGVTVSGSGTGSLLLSGTQTAINAFIAASSVTYTTALNANGSVTMTVTTNDGGNTGSGGALTDVDTVTLAITPVNDLPVGRDATVTTNEDVPLTFSLANFQMNDVEDGTNVNPSAVRIDTLPTNGSLYLNGVLVTAGQVISAAAISGGQLQFVSQPDANGTNYTSLTFSVRDSNGGFDAAPNTITVNVTPVNDGAPIAGADAFTTTLGTPITLSPTQLLANDYLPDHARITGVSALAGGSGTLVANADGTYTFTPAAVGNRSFTYTLTDDDGQTSTATVTLNTVAAQDDLATVYESALPTGSGGGSTIATGNVLTNDGGGTSITNVVYNGTTYTASGGVITVNTALGTLVMQASGASAGNYTYTLKAAANNNTAATDLSVTENFQYTSNFVTANLRVGVIDDRPVVYDREIDVSQVPLPSYSLVLVLDTSGSMITSQYGGAVRELNADGTTTLSTRLDMAKEALVELVTQYYQQAQNVSVKIVTFNDTATTLNGGAAYTTAASAIAAINGITTSGGGTNYQAGLDAARAAFGTVDTTRSNAVYFLSDGVPGTGNTATGIANYTTFVTNNGIKSYAVGIGTGLSSTTSLDSIHNVDSDGNGVKDPAIIVPDLNDLSSDLLSTVPPAYGGNVVSNGSSGAVLGADGGFIKTLTMRLDSNADGTPDTDVTFTYNSSTKQISTNGAFLTGFPKSGDLLTLGSGQGFGLGTLTFNFTTGNYTYYTNGLANQGDSFVLHFVAQDGDGDLTPNTALTFNIVNGVPVARPDSDTIGLNDSFADGNVITGLSTDGGLAAGGQVASFSAKGSGADTAVDNAQVTSITFQGQTFSLTTNVGTTTGTNYTYSVSNGLLTWAGTGANAGASLLFDNSGYYKYTPPTGTLTTTPHGSLITNAFTSSATANANGVTLSAEARDGTASTVTYSTTGAGVNGGGVTGVTNSTTANASVDNLEHLVITFNQATYAYGVQDISFTINAANSNLGDNANGVTGVVASLTYTVYDVAGNELGQFYSSSEGTVTLPSEFTNVGHIVIEPNSAAYARVQNISFDAVQLDTTAPAVDPVQVDYTLTDKDGSSSSSTLTLNVVSNNIYGTSASETINGTNANDHIMGGAGNDIINGGTGADILEGGLGNDTLNGGDGNDLLRGGDGNDVLNGGNGNDVLVGGKGNDTLTGGAGSDVFRWEFGDQGAAGAPASDIVTDFNTAAKSSGGDVLDLRDLLQGETLTGSATGNLTSFLHFAKVGGDTVIQISSGGGFSGGFNPGAIDQTITLQGVDLTASGSLSTDQQIIQDLLSKQKLLVDGG